MEELIPSWSLFRRGKHMEKDRKGYVWDAHDHWFNIFNLFHSIWPSSANRETIFVNQRNPSQGFSITIDHLQFRHYHSHRIFASSSITLWIGRDNSSPSSFESCSSKLVLNFSKTPRPKAQILEAGRFTARYSWHRSENGGLSSVHHPFSIWQCVKTNSTPSVHIKIAGKWMFIPLKMVLIGIDIDPYPYFPNEQMWIGYPINQTGPNACYPPILPATHVEISRTSTFALKHQNERAIR